MDRLTKRMKKLRNYYKNKV